MSDLNSAPKSWRDEPILSGMAFVVIFGLSMMLGVVLLVGIGIAEPRPAALFMLLPAALMGAIGAAFSPTRRFFSSLFGT